MLNRPYSLSSMPDGLFHYVLVYQDHGIKFCQLRPLWNHTHTQVALELINIFCIFGPPSILQADNGKEFSHGATKFRQVVLDDEVSGCIQLFYYTSGKTSWMWMQNWQLLCRAMHMF